MYKVLRYTVILGTNGKANIDIPVSAKIIHCSVQKYVVDYCLLVWAVVNSDMAYTKNRSFLVVKTGEEFNNHPINLEYISSSMDKVSQKWYHVFELINKY